MRRRVVNRPDTEFKQALLASAFTLHTGETLRVADNDGTTVIELEHGCLWIYQAGELFGGMLKPGSALTLARPTLICALEPSSVQRHSPAPPWPPGH